MMDESTFNLAMTPGAEESVKEYKIRVSAFLLFFGFFLDSQRWHAKFIGTRGDLVLCR